MATTRLNPILSFRDEARAAMEHYRDVLGGDLVVTTFADAGLVHDPADADKVMHAQLTTPEGHVIMAGDTPTSMGSPGPNGAIALSGDDASRLPAWWEGLSDGATVTVPLGPAPWGDEFGMCTDRFGVTWLVDIGPVQG